MQDHDPYGTQAGFPEQQAYGTEAWEQPRRTSIAAILGLISSLIFCIPVITQVLGILFGLAGILSVATSEGRRKGIGLSIAAIVLSGLLLIGWGLAGVGGYRFLETIASIPITFTSHVFAGDYDDARQLMAPTVQSTVTDQDFETFRQELETKYGAFQSAEWDPTWHAVGVEAQKGQQQQYKNAMPWCLKLHFSNQTIDAIFELEPRQQGQQQPTSFQDLFLVRRVTIMRPDQTFWVFPAASTTAPPADNAVPGGETTPSTPESQDNQGNQDEGDGGGG